MAVELQHDGLVSVAALGLVATGRSRKRLCGKRTKKRVPFPLGGQEPRHTFDNFHFVSQVDSPPRLGNVHRWVFISPDAGYVPVRFWRRSDSPRNLAIYRSRWRSSTPLRVSTNLYPHRLMQPRSRSRLPNCNRWGRPTQDNRRLSRIAGDWSAAI